ETPMRFGLQNTWTTRSKRSYAKRQPERALFLIAQKGQRPANLNLQEFDPVREAVSISHSGEI
ncbi:MAG: hypothetical protein WBE38_04565, partial [Terracidiphilus sp.]